MRSSVAIFDLILVVVSSLSINVMASTDIDSHGLASSVVIFNRILVIFSSLSINVMM